MPKSGSDSPVVVLIEPERGQHDHTDVMSKAGFRAVSVPAHRASVKYVLGHRPNVVAAELAAANADQTWAFVRRFREDRAGRFIPCVVYGHGLQPDDIETAARAGALWLQLEP